MNKIFRAVKSPATMDYKYNQLLKFNSIRIPDQLSLLRPQRTIIKINCVSSTQLTANKLPEQAFRALI